MMTGNKSVVICSVLEHDAGQALARIADVPTACGIVELRADHLRTAEVVDVVRRCGRPMMVTTRRCSDGGAFAGSELERRQTHLAALDAGARYVDVEWDSGLRDLADGARSSHVVLSHHGGACEPKLLNEIVTRLSSASAAKLKVVPQANSIRELVAVRQLLGNRQDDRRLTCFAMGREGAIGRLLAPAWGSWATYGRPVDGNATAAGQFHVDELLELYRVLSIDSSTRLFGLIGGALSLSPSPAMHAAGYRSAKLDARYLPIEFDDFWSFRGLPELLGFEAFGVTMPFKREAAIACLKRDPLSEVAGAVNTVRVRSDGWHGFNTDGPAVVQAIAARTDPGGMRVSILGAGGTASAIGAALAHSGARVTLFNRDLARAAHVAKRLGVGHAGFDEWPGEDCQIVVNATPLGRNAEVVLADIPSAGQIVVDAAYGRDVTPLVREARHRGLVVIDGFEMLLGQAILQFQLMTGEWPDREAMSLTLRQD